MITLSVERKIDVPLEKVWAVAGDFKKSPDPSLPITIVNDGDENGIGCERVIKSGKSEIRERLENIDPPNSYTYVMLSGAPVKQYTGKAEFSSLDGGTFIKWSVAFVPKMPGTGWIIKRVTIKNYNKFIDELEKLK